MFLGSGILLCAVLGLLKSLWLQELSTTEAVQELGDFWCV